MTRRAFVSTFTVPRPYRDSGSKRLFDMMRALRTQGWEVTFVAAIKTDRETDARRLRRLGVTVYDAEQVDLETLAGTGSFDVALFAFWQVAEYMAPLFRARSPRTRIVVDSVDAQFLRDARRAFRAGPSGGPTALLGSDYGDAIAGELNAYAAADCVLTVSHVEAELIGSLVNDRSLAHSVPDGERAEAGPASFDQRAGMLFVGGFKHLPNADAVRYACEEILPLVPEELRRRHPFYVVGDSLDDSIRAYGNGLDHVRMVGWVPTLTPYYERARIVLAPLRYGAGTKRKVVQALMAHVPIVASSIGAEGLHLEHERDVLVADDPQSFAGAIERLLQDRPLWEQLASSNAHVMERHNEEAAAEALATALDAALARDPKPALLPHPSHEQFRRRIRYQSAQGAMPKIEEALEEFVAPGVTVVVAHGGIPELLRLDRRRVLPLPDIDGEDGTEVIVELERLAQEGAEVLVVPNVALWQNEALQELQPAIRSRFVEIASAEACSLYTLRQRSLPRADGGKSD